MEIRPVAARELSTTSRSVRVGWWGGGGGGGGGGGESGRSGGEVEQNHSAERNQPSDAPDTWQSIGRSPTETAREETGREEVSSDEEHDWEECEEEREGQRSGSPPSTQPSQTDDRRTNKIGLCAKRS